MDFKTAQAMKAQKLASEARKQKNGDIQKAAGESKPQITTQSMGVKTAMSLILITLKLTNRTNKEGNRGTKSHEKSTRSF